MNERDERLVELDEQLERNRAVREHLDALIRLAWTGSGLPESLAFEMRSVACMCLDIHERGIAQERRAVERKIAEEGEDAKKEA